VQRNTWRRTSSGDRVKYAFFAALGLLFIAFEYGMIQLLLRQIVEHPRLGELRIVLLVKLLDMVFLILGAMLVYSAMVTTIAVLYLAPEMPLLLSWPLGLRPLVTYRFGKIALLTSWMLILFGSPILVAYGVVTGAPASFFLSILPLLCLYALAPCAAGFLVAVLFMLVFSPRRVQQVLTAAGLLLVSGMILLIRWLRPEQLVDPIGAEALTTYLSTLRLPAPAWLPSHWAAELVQAATEGRFSPALRELARLAGLGILGTAIALESAVRLFPRGRASAPGPQRSGSFWSRLLPIRTVRHVWRKDLVLLLRDSTQWSQFLILAALVLVYVYNFQGLPYALYQYTTMMSFVSIGGSGLILAAIAARFAFPALSLEAPALPLLLSAPIDWPRFLIGKLLFHLCPSLLIGELLIIFSNKVLGSSLRLQIIGCLSILLIAVGVNALAIGIGVLYPRFSFRHAAEIPVGLGGLLFMILATILILVVVTSAALPEILRFYPPWYRFVRALQGSDRWLAPLPALLATALSVWIPYRLALQRLQRLEL
jgi:ABC-2 type transport system permease protein